MIYALDTNTVAYAFKGMGGVKERLLATPRDAVAIPAVVAYEIEYGLARQSGNEKRRAQWAEFLSTVRVLPLNVEAAREAALIRTELEAAGQAIGPQDVLIAGIAAAHGATLVTHNVREFGRIGRLAMIDWYEENEK